MFREFTTPTAKMSENQKRRIRKKALDVMTGCTLQRRAITVTVKQYYIKLTNKTLCLFASIQPGRQNNNLATS